MLNGSLIIFCIGADISDYFNYGFTEDTWKQYCEKQRRMRIEGARGSYVRLYYHIQNLFRFSYRIGVPFIGSIIFYIQFLVWRFWKWFCFV